MIEDEFKPTWEEMKKTIQKSLEEEEDFTIC